MPRSVALSLGGICVFVTVAAVMLKVMPGPLKDFDYFVAGSVATLVALAMLFVVLLSTTLKSKNPFFRKRKK